jgi:protoheme IX farnesyltransferase
VRTTIPAPLDDAGVSAPASDRWGLSAVPATSVADRTRALVAVVGAYVALTKPRIIELLLVTTIPTMVLAERCRRSVWSSRRSWAARPPPGLPTR